MKHEHGYIMFTSLIIILFLISCTSKSSTKMYLADIGDTKFNDLLDNTTFKFCDTTSVLHKRAYVKYKGGIKNLEEDLIAQYKINPRFKNFTGYFIIRFAVNCNDESGRFRWEIVDQNFNETTCSKELENHIITLVKGLNKWKHPFYRGKSYDGYTYIIVKLENGNIIPS